MSIVTDAEFRQMQADALSDALVELVNVSPDCAKETLVETIKSWYDYHYQEMQKWKLLGEMIGKEASWAGLMEMK